MAADLPPRLDGSAALVRSLVLLLALAAALLAGGCAQKAAQEPGSPSYKPKPQAYPQPPAPVTSDDARNGGGDMDGQPTSLQSAAQQLDSAEREVAELLAKAVPPPPAVPSEPGPSQGVTPAPTPQQNQAAPLVAAAQRCSLACRALGSMNRSAARICDLAGADDDRCTSARDRVDRARKRVEDACSACAA